MSGYISNCPISMPINIPGVRPEVDLNAFHWSYDWGPVYVTMAEEPYLRTPQDL